MTLVELLVVLGIIGLVVGMSTPALMRFATSVHLKTATREVVGLLSLARNLAISAQEEHAVIIDRAEGLFQVVNRVSGESMEKTLRLPQAVTVDVQRGGSRVEDPEIVFRPSGALDGRTVSIVLATQERERTITVSGATGAVELE